MNLLQRLRQVVSDERDIEAVIWSAAGTAHRRLSQERVQYMCGERYTTVYATVKFRRGRISTLEPGPGLQSTEAQEALLQRASEETALKHGYMTGTRILVCDVNLRGTILCDGLYRVDPLHDSVRPGPPLDWTESMHSVAPAARRYGPPFPLSLQVRTPASPNSVIQIRRHFEALEVVQNLLALLVHGRIRPFHEGSDRVWSVLNVGDGVRANHLIQPGFSSPTIPSYDSPVARHAPVVGADGYFSKRYDNLTEVSIPTTFDTDFSCAWNLSGEAGRCFRRSIHWFSLGLRNRPHPSLSLLSFATAIECLLPDVKRERCSSCNAQMGPGPTRLFKQHIFQYGEVPPDLPDLRARIYGARSALIHGSFAASIDNIVPTYGGDAEEEIALVEHVTRTSLINWLRNQASTDPVISASSSAA